MTTSFNAVSLHHHLFPRLEMWELVNFYAGPRGCHDPADSGYVCDGDVISNDKARF